MINIITTVGTSLFANFLKKYPQYLNTYRNLEGKPFRDLYKYQTEVNRLTNDIGEFMRDNGNASAEISSSIARQKIAGDSKVNLYLLCSDSILSYQAATFCKQFFTHSEIQVIEVIIIADLEVQNKAAFETDGLSNLINYIYPKIKQKFDNNGKPFHEKWLINITGGYKGVIPYLTLIGQVSNLEIFYLFEETSDIIRIPQMPVQFDMTFAEELYVFLSDSNYWNEESIYSELCEYDFIAHDKWGKLKTTGLGQLFMQMVEAQAPFAKNVLGLTVELKIFEFYLSNLPSGYTHVLHSSQLLNEGESKQMPGGEIDILITRTNSEVPGEEPVIIEVKPIAAMRAFDKGTAKQQLAGKISLLKKNNITSGVIRYIVYSFGKLTTQSFVKSQINSLRTGKEEIEQMVKAELPGVRTEVYYLPITLQQKKHDNIYKTFMQTTIQQQQFYEVK